MTAPTYADPPRPVVGVHAVEIDGELVLYEPVTNRAAHLDGRASVIWRVLDGRVSVAELSDDLGEVFGADPAVVRRDVEAMLTELHGLGFLEPEAKEKASAPRVPNEVLPDPPSP